MRSIKVQFTGDAEQGYVFSAPSPTKRKEFALLIASDHSMWLLDQETAQRVIDEYGEECNSAMIGKTDGIIIYPTESASTIDGEKYILGECLIMKADIRLSCLKDEEMKTVFAELISRTAIISLGQYSIPAYQVD